MANLNQTTFANPQTRRAGDNACVFVIDDDDGMRRSVCRMLESSGFSVVAFANPIEFLAGLPPDAAGCVLLDIDLPFMNGFDVQQELVRRQCGLPVIFITGHTNTAMIVQAMKAGAFDFYNKPFVPDALLAGVRAALEHDRRQREARLSLAYTMSRSALLSCRELEVARLVASGLSNKQIAAELGIVEKTVAVHRGHAMKKLEVGSLPDLVRLLDRLEQP